MLRALHYVTVTARFGQHDLSHTYLLRATSPQVARKDSRKEFRKAYNISRWIPIRSRVLFYGTEMEANAFYDRLMEKLKQDDVDVEEGDL